MNAQYLFPFCVINDLGNPTEVTGTISISCGNFSASKDILLNSQTWNNQTEQDHLIIDMPDHLITETGVTFNISVTVEQRNCLVLIMEPVLKHDMTVDVMLVPVKQRIVDTDFNTTGVWHNLPIRDRQQAIGVVTLKIPDSINTVVDFLADKITFREELTYIEQPVTKTNLSIEENIEYYLGKDKVKNLYFEKTIPAVWDIPTRPNNSKASTVGIAIPNDPTEYCYNNLGYRADIDYTIELLQGKKIILCLGDSDTFGIGVDYKKLWSCLLNQKLGSQVITLNMGVPGISIDGIARVGVRAIEALSENIQAVCVHYPLMSLREFVSKHYEGGVHTHRNYNLPYKDWWNHIDWKSNNYNFYRSKLLLENTCAKYNIEFHDLYINKTDTKIPLDSMQYKAYTSIGPHTHSAIANYFYKKITNRPSLFQTLQS